MGEKNDGAIEVIKNEIILKDKEMADITSRLNNEFASEHKNVRAEEENLAKAVVKATSSWQHKEEESKTAANEVKKAKVLFSETQKLLEVKDDEIKKETSNIEKCRQS